MGALSTAAGVALDALLNPANANPGSEQEQVEIEALAATIKWLVQVVEDIAESSHNAVNKAKDDARDTGGAIQALGNDYADIIRHTYSVVIPHSQEWTYGRVVKNLIEPLKERVGKVEKSVRFLMGWRGQIDTWKKDYVTPHIEDWRKFNSYYHTWPIQVSETLHGWLLKPATFGDWAAPAIATPLVKYLATNAEAGLLDQLTREIVDASPDVFRHVEAAAVAILLTDQ